MVTGAVRLPPADRRARAQLLRVLRNYGGLEAEGIAVSCALKAMYIKRAILAGSWTATARRRHTSHPASSSHASRAPPRTDARPRNKWPRPRVVARRHH